MFALLFLMKCCLILLKWTKWKCWDRQTLVKLSWCSCGLIWKTFEWFIVNSDLVEMKKNHCKKKWKSLQKLFIHPHVLIKCVLFSTGYSAFDGASNYGHTPSHHTSQFPNHPFKHEDTIPQQSNMGKVAFKLPLNSFN